MNLRDTTRPVAALPLLLPVAVAMMLCACTPQKPAGAAAAPAAAAATTTVTTADPGKLVGTIQDIMDSEVDPAADFIWAAVSTTVTRQGTLEHRPRTDKEWHEVRRRAIVLAEAANLLAMPGRRAASGNVGLEDGAPLDTAAIQKRLDANPTALAGFADALRSVSAQFLGAVDRRDADAITELGGTLDEVCEACHRTYWYPDEPVRNVSVSVTGGK